MNKQSFFTTSLLQRKLLSHAEQDKKVFHLIFDISKNLAVHFSPGDSVAILPENDPIIVEKILEILPLKEPKNGKTSLITEYNITRLSGSFLHFYSELTQNKILEKILQDELSIKELISTHELWDFLNKFPPPKNLSFFDDFLHHLPRLTPRYYSIASSQKMSPNTLELLISKVEYSTSGIERFGVTTHFLCDLVKLQETKISFFIQPTAHFHLPKNPDQDIICVGAGTGLAPFRAFLQERLFTHTKGKNWLFFGERHEKENFYFRDFLESLVQNKQLKLSCAFSRDQKEKIYVQDLMLKEKKEFLTWLEHGAILYLCGDAKKMAKDVEKTILSLIQEEAMLPHDEAEKIIRKMKVEKRLRKDVY